MFGLRFVIFGLVLLGASGAEATQCPGNLDALGTSRTIVVDTTEHPRIGTMQYRETLPLEDHEVVLAFDDGPIPPHSTGRSKFLPRNASRRAFFLVGEMARRFPTRCAQSRPPDIRSERTAKPTR
jgi:peptidoglycan-N-acetylglucosamine deacetylase